MKRIRFFIAIGLISSLFLGGCQKASEPLAKSRAEESVIAENSGEESIEDNEVEEEKNLATANESDSAELLSMSESDDECRHDDEIDQDNEGGQDNKSSQNNNTTQTSLISGLRIVHRDNNYYGENYERLVIGHSYEQLSLSDDAKKQYPELEKAVMMVNDLIGTDEANCYYADYIQASKVGNAKDLDHPVSDMDWDIFVRRADRDVLSILIRIITASYEDYNHVRYLAYNIKPDTGEVINLSDIIEDEDALYDKLAQKFHKLLETDYAEFVAGGEVMSEADIVRNLEESAYSEQLVWTLDPQGVSFWLSSMNLAPVSMSTKIMFSEDEKGRIFTKDVRENIPATWVTQLYPSLDELIDADDDGSVDTINVMEIKEYSENADYEYTAGTRIDFNGKEKETSAEGDDYDFEFSLIHQNGKSVLLMQYKEYESDIQELYKLDKNGALKTGSLCGWICGGPDETFSDFSNYSYVAPIITDPSYFQIGLATWLLSTADAVMEYRITEDGNFKCLSDRGMIFEDSRYVISLKMPLDGIPVVDAKSGELTEETANLKAGAKLKLMYTDTYSYVDCLTEDNKLVRINVLFDQDLGHCVEIDGSNVGVQEVFDDMFFAG